MPIPSQRKYDKAHLARLDKYASDIRAIYLEIIEEISKLGVSARLNSKGEFYFRNYKAINDRVNELMKRLYSEVYGTTVSGIHTEWDSAVEKNNELTRWVYGEDLDKIPAEYRNKYLSNNAAARKAFTYRKVNGLQLSDKVWKNTRQFKKELELALELSIGKGKSAGSIASEIKQYLNDPNKLFRRVRDEKGVLRLSKAALAYNPGQGRYRSSYKNAHRLARNEINFSYEASQKEKRNQQDFIVGIEIHVSPGHDPADDKGGIKCIDLQGRYPKDFDWTYKWHVSCICYSKNVLKTREELDQDIDNILAGKEPNTPSKNAVSEKPTNYTDYLKNNQKKWDNWKTVPFTFANN